MNASWCRNATGTLAPGETIHLGRADDRGAAHSGHTAGMLSLLVDGTDVFTGDTLFKGSVGGVRAPGHTTYADLPRFDHGDAAGLPPSTPSTRAIPTRRRSARELEHNRFVRIWRGIDPEGSDPCTALGEPATLILLGDDYDGGHKAWVRWPDGTRRHRARLPRAVGDPTGARPRAADPTRSIPRLGRCPRTRSDLSSRANGEDRGSRRARRSAKPARTPRTWHATNKASRPRSSGATSRPPSRSSRRSER